MATKQKIEIGLIISLVGLILVLTTNLIAYGRSDQKQSSDIETLQKQSTKNQASIDKVLVIENDVEHIKETTDEMKTDIKTLLNRK